MAEEMRRREFLASGSAALAALAGAGMISPRLAHAAGQELHFVTWGAAWIEVSRVLAAEYVKGTGDKINWELHAGGAMAIVGKIKPVWPNVTYNMISGWDPTFLAMRKEGWIEPVSIEEMPALAPIPKPFFVKSATGQLMSVPLSTAGAFWGYRTDMVDKPLESLEQLLEPRFKGSLSVPFPVNLTGLLMVSLAMQRGGSERNLEPGWGFVKELASKGQIARVHNNNSEFINALSSGEASVGFMNLGAWAQVSKRAPIKLMARPKDNKVFIFNEGFVIMKGPPEKVAAAKKFANWLATPAVNERYNIPLGTLPVIPGTKPAPELADVMYSNEDLEKYAHFADFEYIAGEVDGFAKRWETEIVPLLRRA